MFMTSAFADMGRVIQHLHKVYKAFTSKAAERYFNTSELLRLLKVHKTGKKNYSRKIWTVYMFLLWYDMNFGE